MSNRVKVPYGEFLQIQAGGSNTLWRQLPIGDTAGRDEAWLRDLLQTEPNLLPVDKIDSSFGPLISVCTELRVGAGFVDNVFIDHHGRLTLVECKLWRNPESRRKVVAQILDYAKELGQWSYSDLQRRVSAKTGTHGNVLFELVKSKHPELSEHRFADAVTRSLRSGRFLLLIAGDGIREEVQALGDLLNRNVAMGFSFGMFEMALYGGQDGQLLVQPRAVLRTRLIERTVVVLQDGRLAEKEELQDGQAEAPSPQAKAAQTIHKESAMWWAPVLAFTLDDPDQQAFQYRWPHHIRGALPWPGTWIMAYRSSGHQPSIGVYVRGREIPLLELLRALEPEAEQILADLPEGAEFKLEDKVLGVTRRWDEFANDDARRHWLANSINTFVNALRWRVSKLRQTSTE